MAEKITKVVTLIVVVALAAILIGLLFTARKLSVVSRPDIEKSSVALPQNNEVVAPVAVTPGQKVFVVQIAAFSDKTKSDMIAGLVKKGIYSAVVVPGVMPDKKVWYRVLVGDFDTFEKAKACLVEMQKMYKGSFIKQK
jgi:cell division septation protein DedD